MKHYAIAEIDGKTYYYGGVNAFRGGLHFKESRDDAIVYADPQVARGDLLHNLQIYYGDAWDGAVGHASFYDDEGN